MSENMQFFCGYVTFMAVCAFGYAVFSLWPKTCLLGIVSYGFYLWWVNRGRAKEAP